MAYKQFWVAK